MTDNKYEYPTAIIETDGIAANDTVKVEPKVKKISKCVRFSVYIMFTLINIIVNMDSGNIPPVIKDVALDFDISEATVGAFASLVSFGTFLGGMISFSVIDLFPRKLILIFANLGIAICLFTFPISKNIVLLFFNRILVGTFMVSLIF